MTEIVRKITDLIRTVGVRRRALRTRKPIIGYIGWSGHGNLGDDAMWEAARNTLPNHVLLQYDAPQREKLLARFGLSGPRYFRSVILGGGTLISPRFFPPVVESALDQGILVWSLGTGVGSSGFEMEPDVDLTDWKRLLSQIPHLGVRGPRSLDKLSTLGISHSVVIGDLALSLTQGKPQPPTKSFVVNIAASDQTAKEERQLFAAVIPTLSRLAAQGWTPIPVAMTDSDIAPTERLMRHITPAPTAVRRLATSQEFFEAVSPCAFTMSVRLHGAVLSCCAGVPPIMLGYRDKCLDFMESMELEQFYIPWESITEEMFAEKIAMLEDLPTEIRQEILSRAHIWKDRQEAFIKSHV
ncbi:MAG: polysaccharide pyruvyl transferase family protein [Capsulimonas sp.]|jgi:hypothetical protein|uniref:polysaccharide pyruvyl transferase family protein n=1 Tax=Capsulimonas sp. TaxID=2494211 RepID=UPI0032664F0A|nr:hypothetical protein [Capsulimonas sp.]